MISSERCLELALPLICKHLLNLTVIKLKLWEMPQIYSSAWLLSSPTAYWGGLLLSLVVFLCWTGWSQSDPLSRRELIIAVVVTHSGHSNSLLRSPTHLHTTIQLMILVIDPILHWFFIFSFPSTRNSCFPPQLRQKWLQQCAQKKS